MWLTMHHNFGKRGKCTLPPDGGLAASASEEETMRAVLLPATA